MDIQNTINKAENISSETRIPAVDKTPENKVSEVKSEEVAEDESKRLGLKAEEDMLASEDESISNMAVRTISNPAVTEKGFIKTEEGAARVENPTREFADQLLRQISK